MSDPVVPITGDVLPPLEGPEIPEVPKPPATVQIRYSGDRAENARLAARDRQRDDRGLTRRQRALVDIMLSEGVSASEAARRAGFRDGQGVRVAASRTLALPKVQAYLVECINREMAKTGIRAMRRMRHLIDHAKSEFVQLEASKDVLDRAGISKKPQSDQPLVSIDIDLG